MTDPDGRTRGIAKRLINAHGIGVDKMNSFLAGHCRDIGSV